MQITFHNQLKTALTKLILINLVLPKLTWMITVRPYDILGLQCSFGKNSLPGGSEKGVINNYVSEHNFQR